MRIENVTEHVFLHSESEQGKEQKKLFGCLACMELRHRSSESH